MPSVGPVIPAAGGGLGPTYSFSGREGQQLAIQALAPYLVGEDPTSPYFQAGDIPPGGAQPGASQPWRAPIQTRNTLLDLLLQQYDPRAAGGLPYSESPGKPVVGRTGAALEGMARRSGETAGGYGPSQTGVLSQDIQRLEPAAQAQLALQEQQRVGQLLQILLGVYGLGGQMTAEPLSELSRLREMIAQERLAKRQFYSGIPIAGGLVAGTL